MPAEPCVTCHSLHAPTAPMDTEPLLTCLAAFSVRMVALLRSHSGNPTRCKACQAEIYFVRHANGKSVPYTPEGLNHFIDCPDAKDFQSR